MRSKGVRSSFAKLGLLRALCVKALLFLPVTAFAHIGSPDTFVQAAIGPYNVLVAVHPPAVCPGALEIDLRFNTDDRITSIATSLDGAPPTAVPLVLDGTATTSLWAATPGAHTLHVTVQGSRGSATYTVNLPASPQSASSRPKRFGFIETRSGETPVFVVIAFVFVVAIVSAGVLAFLGVIPAGNLLPLRRRKYLLFATAFLIVSLAALAALLLLPYNPRRPTTITATLNNSHLDFSLNNPSETFDNLVPDHGKLLHLFLIREPNKDVFLHLHPQQVSPGHFDAALPAMPPGTYTLFADFYHSDNTGETATLRLTLPPQSHSSTTDPDDTTAVVPKISWVAHPSAAPSPIGGVQMPHDVLYTFTLHDNYTLQLQTPAHLTPLHANLLVATLLDPTGQPPQDMALYLGMTAHAVVLRYDDAVFAHIHPGGTLPMLMPARPDGSMPGMAMTEPSNTATIPYGFPSSGLYRVFVQMKHGNIVETAAFDLTVE